MRRSTIILALAVAFVGLSARPAFADVTAFLGSSMNPSTRSAKGVAIGIGLIVVGFEFEYSRTVEDEREAAPEVRTGMGNLVVMTPTTKLQLYGTTGGGLYHEVYRDTKTTNIGTNVGGGVKIALAGPLKLRLDYRVFSFNGKALYKRMQRMYAGVSLSF